MVEKYIRICPICNSPDVSPDLSVAAAVAYGALYNYRCNHCGYVGNIFLEVPAGDLPAIKDVEEIPKDFPVIDVSYGRGYFRLLRYLSVFGAFAYLILYISHPSLYFLAGVALFTLLSAYLFFFKSELKSPAAKIAVLAIIGFYVIAFRIF